MYEVRREVHWCKESKELFVCVELMEGVVCEDMTGNGAKRVVTEIWGFFLS